MTHLTFHILWDTSLELVHTDSVMLHM